MVSIDIYNYCKFDHGKIASIRVKLWKYVHSKFWDPRYMALIQENTLFSREQLSTGTENQLVISSWRCDGWIGCGSDSSPHSSKLMGISSTALSIWNEKPTAIKEYLSDPALSIIFRMITAKTISKLLKYADFNAKHTHREFRLMTPKGRRLWDVLARDTRLHIISCG